MKVFVTGSSGYCGKEIVRELVSAGHEVRGLSRSEDGVAAVTKLGATGVLGDSNDLDLIKREASAADAVIHLAFDHSFTDMVGACAKEQAVIDTVCGLYDSTSKIVIYTSAMGLGIGIADFDEDAEIPAGGNPRGGAEVLATQWRKRGVRVVGIRLPVVHGGDMGKGNFWLTPVNADMTAGCVGIVNGGENVYTDCNVRDVARLYVLALENPDASRILHAVAGATKYKDLATASAAHLKLPIKHMTPDEAPGHYGWFANFIQVDAPGDAKKTFKRIGWAAREKTLLQALKDGEPAYFQKV